MSIKLKVVVLGDNEPIADNIVNMLFRDENIESVFVEHDGEEGLISILNNEPDLIFTDNQMPKKTGIELIEELEHYTFEEKPKVVLVTGDTDPDIYQKARELGFEIVQKPISEETVHRIVKEVVDGQVTDYIKKSEVENKTSNKSKGLFSKWLNNRK